MDELSLGDQVLTEAGFEAVFLFGEREGTKLARFVVITTATHQIQMTPDHFIPVKSQDKMRMKRAMDVTSGDAISVQQDGKQMATAITSVSTIFDQGLYNPYTPSGSIIVNGVLASVHSRWILDDVCDALGCVEHLPWLYQWVFRPIRFFCWFVGLFGGPAAFEAVDNFFCLTYVGLRYPKLASVGATCIAIGTSACIGILTAKLSARKRAC